MLENKVIIITGAAQGIGAQVAQGLHDLGAKVVLADIADSQPAAEAISSDALALHVDVTDANSCQKMIDDSESHFGRVDGIVCNAALFTQLPTEAFADIEDDLWDKVMAVNVKGPWLCTKAALPAFKRNGHGSIVMIGTNRVLHGFPGLLHYDASKGAVQAMTRSMIREVGHLNVRINTIMPGLTMSEGVLAREGIQDRAPEIAAGRSIARDQQPSDLIGPIAFFLSDHAGFVSGQSLVVDGGGIVQ